MCSVDMCLVVGWHFLVAQNIFSSSRRKAAGSNVGHLVTWPHRRRSVAIGCSPSYERNQTTPLHGTCQATLPTRPPSSVSKRRGCDAVEGQVSKGGQWMWTPIRHFNEHVVAHTQIKLVERRFPPLGPRPVHWIVRLDGD